MRVMRDGHNPIPVAINILFERKQLLTGKKAVLSYLQKRLLLDVDSVTKKI